MKRRYSERRWGLSRGMRQLFVVPHWLLGAAVLAAPAAAETGQVCVPAPVTVPFVAKALASSELALAGTVLTVAPSAERSGAGRVRVRVERAFKGTPAADTWYRYRSSYPCPAWAPRHGERAVFFAYKDGPDLLIAPFEGLYDRQDVLAEVLRTIERKP